MNKITEEIKEFTFGGINKQISESDIDPLVKARLFSRQIWLNFISWFFRVVVLGGLVFIINSSLDRRRLDIVQKKNDLQIELKRYSYSDSVHAKSLGQYVEYEPIQRYRFLNHMRYTAPDSVIRSLYDSLYYQFYQKEGKLVEISIATLYEAKSSELDPKLHSKEKLYEKQINDTSLESQEKAKQTKEEIEKILAIKDDLEQLVDKAVTEMGNDAQIDAVKNSLKEVEWEKNFLLKQSYNKTYFIKRLADDQLIIGLKEVVVEKPQSAVIYIRVGTLENPSYYEEKKIQKGTGIDIKIEQSENVPSVPENILNKTFRIELKSVWKTGFRKWAEFSCAYNPKSK